VCLLCKAHRTRIDCSAAHQIRCTGIPPLDPEEAVVEHDHPSPPASGCAGGVSKSSCKYYDGSYTSSPSRVASWASSAGKIDSASR
jgi:hypothetical protein